MPYKIQEQEFNWVSLVGTWKCKTKKKYICICSVSLWKEHVSSHSPQDNICLFIHILCEGCLPPNSSGYILCWLFTCCSSVPSPPSFSSLRYWSWSLRVRDIRLTCWWRQVFVQKLDRERKAGSWEKGFFIAMSCPFHFDNRR